ncbi:substrate-binding periplasmic protein [Neptuniibacter pectenicola]|uniref:substrate-binding periplasmic protein n=1 Tax=Neptuniibacter pectenicola TaxID=1806669 RepID=UPI003F4BF475
MPRAHAEQILIAADRWCPFNCEPGPELPGFMVEVAQRVFAKQGYDVKYIEMNWSRAIQEARKGNVNAIMGGFKSDAPDFVYPEEELAVLGNAFFVRKESDWTYEGLESLKNVQLGAILGYDYGDELRGYIQESNADSVTMLNGDYHSLSQGIKLLNKRRIDVIIEVEPVFWYTADQLGLSDQFKFTGKMVQPEKAYIAFSPALKKSTQHADLLSDGIRKLRASGELLTILAKYGLKDWKK